MRISPEPLHPMRTWRELWHAEPVHYDRAIRQRPDLQTEPWKDTKRQSFNWLTHLLNRDSGR